MYKSGFILQKGFWNFHITPSHWATPSIAIGVYRGTWSIIPTIDIRILCFDFNIGYKFPAKELKLIKK